MLPHDVKICLVSSHGGHLRELLNATRDVKGKKYFVTYPTAHTRQLLQMERRYFVIDPHLSRAKYLLNGVQSIFHLLRERPRAVISTGAGIAIPTLLLAKYLLRAKTIYIESAACVEEPSKTGAFMYRFADLFLIQWSNLKSHYPRAVCVGLL